MPAPNLDTLLALVGPDATTGVSAPMPAPLEPMTPQLAHLSPLPMAPTPLRTAEPTGHNPVHVPWDELLKQLAPIVAASTMRGPHQTGFLQGYQEGQSIAEQRRAQAQKEAAAKQQAAEQFKLHIFDEARQIQDPQEWAQFVNMATESAMHLGFITDPSEMKSFLTYPQHLQNDARRQELLDKLSTLMKRPDFNDLMEHGATLTLKDGSHISLHDAVTISGALPEMSGQPVGLPTVAVEPKADLSGYLTSFAKARGKTVAQLTPAEWQEAQVAYEASKRPPVDTEEDRLKKDLLRAQIGATNRSNKPQDQQGAASPYSQERAQRTIQSVDELMGKVSNWTTGAGSLLAGMPATEARNFKAEVDTLKSNIAFNELTQMREASKTGGALGQVSDREETLLSSALGALDTGQSPANFKAQLAKIRDSIARWQAAHAAQSLNGAGVPGGVTNRIVYDINGKPTTKK
jgi:hypothetical protein